VSSRLPRRSRVCWHCGPCQTPSRCFACPDDESCYRIFGDLGHSTRHAAAPCTHPLLGPRRGLSLRRDRAVVFHQTQVVFSTRHGRHQQSSATLADGLLSCPGSHRYMVCCLGATRRSPRPVCGLLGQLRLQSRNDACPLSDTGLCRSGRLGTLQRKAYESGARARWSIHAAGLIHSSSDASCNNTPAASRTGTVCATRIRNRCVRLFLGASARARDKVLQYL
jgi:hypothetical protein